MTQNPMSNRPWDIHDESVQRKVTDMVNKSKPEFIEIVTNGNDEKSHKLKDFLSMICCVQTKTEESSLFLNQSMFLLSQRVNSCNYENYQMSIKLFFIIRVEQFDIWQILMLLFVNLEEAGDMVTRKGV